jgi:hypothetical protein
MKPSEALAAARALIDAPEKWARYSTEDRVTRWTATAALVHVTNQASAADEASSATPAYGLFYAAYDYLERAVGVQPIVLWHDAPERTWGDVMVALKEAEALAILDGQ